MNKIAIAYRIYPGISKSPYFHSDDKLKLSELGIKSLKLGLGNIEAKIYFLLDNCPEEYKTMILKYFNQSEVEFLEYNGIGNLKTFEKQIEILLNQNFSEIIYFAEDDYLYLPNCFEEGIYMLNNNKADFVSLYDHIDSYRLSFQKIKSKIFLGEKNHWRTNSSTCLTFMTTKQTLSKTKKVFLTYCKGNYDYNIWITLTKYNLLNFTSRENFLLLLRGCFYGLIYIIFVKKYVLITPLPSLCTHLESTGIAPIVDWQDYFKQINK
ncbi:MAG: glycosyltransferase family 2 protein [Candidatus Absconditabacteria bacterium]